MLRVLANAFGWCLMGLSAVVLLIGLAIGEFAVLIVNTPRLSQLNAPFALSAFIFGLPLTFVLAFMVHEAGHLLCAQWAGLTPYFAHVGPLTTTRIAGRWRMGWDWRQPWLGGRAVCDETGATRRQRALFIAGGVLANVTAGSAALCALAGNTPDLIQLWLGQFAVHSFFLSTWNLLPLRERGQASDGLALWLLLVGQCRS